MLRALLVEDEEFVINELLRNVDRSDVSVTVRQSRDAAIEALDAGDYDLIICDLRIPSVDGAIDQDEAHGLAVHYHGRDVCPGTPAILFTGYATTQNTKDALSAGGTADIFADGHSLPIVELIEKKDWADCPKRILEHAQSVAQLDAIELTTIDPPLTPSQERCLRIYARRHGGSAADVSPLGGLSGSRNLQVTVTNADGQVRASVVGKVGSRREVIDEIKRYEDFVAPLLGIGSRRWRAASCTVWDR